MYIVVAIKHDGSNPSIRSIENNARLTNYLSVIDWSRVKRVIAINTVRTKQNYHRATAYWLNESMKVESDNFRVNEF